MRVTALFAAVAIAVFPIAGSPSGAAPGALQVSLTATTHTPKVDARWPYVVRATVGGKPARATVTSQIVDPFGGVHPVEFGDRKVDVVDHPFKGTFRDYVTFPSESVGFKLTFRVIVKAGGLTRAATYWVKVR